MGKVTGKVTKVTKGKGIVTTKFGNYERLNVTVTDSTGTNTVIQKLTKPGNDGQGLMGKEFQVTYTEKELTNEETGESFTVRSADSKNWVSLDQQTNIHSNGSTTAQGTKSTYNSEGARTGMIVGKGVELAIARANLKGLKDITAELLTESTGMVENVTNSLENGSKAALKPTTATNIMKVATVVKKAMTAPAPEVSEDDDESPFED